MFNRKRIETLEYEIQYLKQEKIRQQDELWSLKNRYSALLAHLGIEERYVSSRYEFVNVKDKT